MSNETKKVRTILQKIFLNENNSFAVRFLFYGLYKIKNVIGLFILISFFRNIYKFTGTSNDFLVSIVTITGLDLKSVFEFGRLFIVDPIIQASKMSVIWVFIVTPWFYALLAMSIKITFKDFYYEQMNREELRLSNFTADGIVSMSNKKGYTVHEDSYMNNNVIDDLTSHHIEAVSDYDAGNTEEE